MTAPNSSVYGVQTSPAKGSSARLEITRVIPLWPKKVCLQWTVRNPADVSHYFFQIARSGSPEGPWEVLTPLLLEDAYFYVDDNFSATSDDSQAGLLSLQRNIYYKVTATPGPIEDVKDIMPATDHRRQGIINKLTRDATRYFRVGVGTEVAIFKRRRWGEKCPICLSSTGQSTRAHCSNCFGTGFVGGYWNPTYTFAQIRPSPTQMQTVPQGDIETNIMTVLMPVFPVVEILDVIVFIRTNQRYEIKSVAPTTIHGVTIHQEVTVSELARSAREYNLKADNWHDPKWF
jgi:hypothetical protein